MCLALGWTESAWRYNVIHNEWNTRGFVGIREYFWGKLLGDIDANSLQACDKVWSFLMKKHNNDMRAAMIEWKGAKTNFKSVDKTLEIYEYIKANYEI